MPFFDRIKLNIKPLSERESKTGLDVMINPDASPPKITSTQLSKLEDIALSMRESRKREAPIVFAFGAHLVKNGLSKVLIELMKRGYVQHLLANEAVVIHDWELAFHGRTEEDVKRYMAEGQFGLWDETGKYIAAAIKAGAESNLGYGEAIGRFIGQNCTSQNYLNVLHSNKDISILYNAHKLGIPFSVGVTLGQNITHMHPEMDFEALGKTGGIDFLKFADTIFRFQNGTYISIGSAILSPQIFEKALSMAKNVNPELNDYQIYVNDIQPSGWDWSKGEPPKNNPTYYLRFMKTFNRMGGTSEYIEMDNITFLHNLYHLLKEI